MTALAIDGQLNFMGDTAMHDLYAVLGILALFAVLALCVKGVEKL